MHGEAAREDPEAPRDDGMASVDWVTSNVDVEVFFTTSEYRSRLKWKKELKLINNICILENSGK